MTSVPFVDRVGLALVGPTRAMKLADAGQGGTPDMTWLLVLQVLAAELPSLAVTVWSAPFLGPLAAAGMVARRVLGVISMDLAILVVAWLLIWVGAGRRRAGGRDLDMAAVAWVPVAAVKAVGAAIVAFRPLPRPVTDALWIVALLWTAGLVVLALRVARSRPMETP